MAETFRWWLIVELLGLGGLPISFLVFCRLPDRGYAFAKPLTILLGGYVFWLLLTLHVMTNRPGSVVLCFALLAALSFVVYRRQRVAMAADFKRLILPIIVTEVIFTGVLFTVAHLRSYLPEIAGTEKPMDFMYLNAASRSRFYPPNDAWLSGFHASYYYFGYVIQAMLAKLAAAPTAVAFNIALASTAALAASSAFSLGFNLLRLAGHRPPDKAAEGAAVQLPLPGERVGVRGTASATDEPAQGSFSLAAAWREYRSAIIVGCGAAFFLIVLANLEGVLEFARANGIGSTSLFKSIGIANLAEGKRSATWYPTDQSNFWWWWHATRISPDGGTITEFPFFSFLLGDLHPHVMAIPFVLTSIGGGLALYVSDRPLDRWYWRERPLLLPVLALLFGGLGFLNTWDLPTFGALVVLFVFLRNLRATDPRTALGDSAGFLAPLALLAVVAYLPFYLTFHSQASGLAAVANGATRPVQSLLFWLPLVALTLPLVLWRLLADRDAAWKRQVQLAAAIPAVLLAAWALLLVVDGGRLGHAIGARGWNWWVAGFLAAAFAASATALWREATTEADARDGIVPVLAFTTVAYLLVFGAEFFYVKDVFGSRINTVFKLYYQAWFLLAVAGSFSAWWLVQEWQPNRETLAGALKGAWGAVAAVVVVGALLYPVGATLSRTNGLHAKNRTLDGLAFARAGDADDIAIVDWLKSRAGEGEVVLEGVKGSYTDSARISAWSGLSTPLGWPGHESQWGRDGAMLGTRQKDIDTAYSTPSLADALGILQKYDVTYVVVGSIERSLYPAEGLNKFDGGLEVATKPSPQTTLYRVPLPARDSNVKAP